MSWFTITSRPRRRGGEISAMYIGVTIDAPPIASPAIKRKSTNSGQFRAKPQPSDDTTKQAAKANSTFLRPNAIGRFADGKGADDRADHGDRHREALPELVQM